MDSHDDDDQMTVYLKVMKTEAIKVQKFQTIGSIKLSVCEKEGVPEYFQEIFLNGDRLQNDQRVIDCGIQPGSTLHMILQNPVRLKLLVIIPSQMKTIAVEARTYDTIQKIKSVILDKEGIQPDQYDLIYAGRLLENNRTLASLNLQNESKIQCVFNPNDMLSFSVTTPIGDTLNLNVKVLYSVFNVKAIVGDHIGVPVSEFDLIYNGKQLEESKILASYDIRQGSILQMSRCKFQIFVKTWNGKTITLDVRQCDTINDVEKKVLQKLRAPNPFHSFVFGGKRLEGDRDLAYYSIQKDATLKMVFSPSTSTATTQMELSEIGGGAHGVPDSSTTIRDLKAMIQKKVNSPVKEIYFRGMPLQDELSIAHYQIRTVDKLSVVSERRPCSEDH